MAELNSVLLMLHFLGLAMGLSVSFTNIITMGLIGKAQPPEQAVLRRVPMAMTRVGDIGLTLLWATGLILVFTKYSGFAVLPWQFHAKLTAVVLLTLTVGYAHSLMRKAKNGDAAAMARLPTVGKVATALALTAVIFAVLTFD